MTDSTDMATKTLFSPWDMEVAAVNFDAACGHGALAAAVGCQVCYAMQYFGAGGWVNIPMMKSALAHANVCFDSVDGWDQTGACAVTMIQFLGPWMNPGVPVAARCQHRHWVATREGMVWDCNTGKWQTREEWEKEVPPLLMPKRGTGFQATRSFVFPF